MFDQIVHEELAVERMSPLEPLPAGGDGEHTRVLVASDQGPPVELEVHVTRTALIKLDGRDLREFVATRLSKLAGSFENEGRKLQQLAAMSPVVLHSGHVNN